MDKVASWIILKARLILGELSRWARTVVENLRAKSSQQSFFLAAAVVDGQTLMWENRYSNTQIVTQNMHIIFILYVEAKVN